MNKQDFYNNYKEVFNLDSIDWDMPKFGVKGYVKNLPFKVQVSLKNEIDKDSLFYVMGGLIYHLDLAFLRPELSDETRFPKKTIGKLNAIEIDSAYLTKHELDVKPFKFNTKSVETSQFPIMDKDVKPINDYIQQETKVPDCNLTYNSTFLEDNKNKIDSINALGNPYDFKLPIIGEIKSFENDFNCEQKGNINNFPELETFEAIQNTNLDMSRIKYEAHGESNISGKIPNFFNALHQVIKEKKGVNMEDVNERFNDCIDNRLNECKELLTVKSVEYRRNNDPYHNFNKVSKMRNKTPEEALSGMWAKHLCSILDIIDDIELHNKIPSKELLSEKISDNINYLLILEALIEERRFNNE